MTFTTYCQGRPITRQQPAPQAPGPRRWRTDGRRIVPA